MLNKLKCLAKGTKIWTKHHSPELLLAGGIILAGTAVVTAIISTNKVKKVVAPNVDKIENLKSELNDSNAIANNEINVKEVKRELNKEYMMVFGKTAKTYLPTIITFSASISCILCANHILKGRIAGLSAAYATLQNGYNAYRERVKKAIGEEAEEKIYKDIRTEKVVIDGKEVEIEVAHKDDDDIKTFLFDKYNKNYRKDSEANFDFLLAQEKYANCKLRAKGYLLLEDVYSLLGVDFSTLTNRQLLASKVVGWLYDENDSNRDSYVSFGLIKPNGGLSQVGRDMKCYGEDTVWLEFNFDGDIITGNHNNKTIADTRKI